MNDANENQLMRAFELVEAGKLDDARSLLSPILARDRNNADAWWIYAHAVTDPLVAKDALNNVLRLDPQYPGARELNDQLDAQMVSSPEFAPTPAPAEQPVAADDFPDFERSDGSAKAARREDNDAFNLPRILLIAVVFILIAIIGIFIASQNNNSAANATATTVANATSAATEPVNALPQMVTAEPVDTVTVIAQSLTAFPLRPTDPVTLETTSAGQTLFANVCGAVSAAALADTVNSLKVALGQLSGSVGSDVQTLGIRAIDCVSGTVLVHIGVDVQSAAQFAAGSLSEDGFKSRWNVIN